MNDFMTSDPEIFENAGELMAFLKIFGPLAGRYHVGFPTEWKNKVDIITRNWGELERKKAMRIIEKAKQRKALYSPKKIEWNEDKSWLANMARYQGKQPDRLKLIFANNAVEEKVAIENLRSLDDLMDLPPTEGELINASEAQEFVRVARHFLQRNSEIILIDPYFCPTNQYRKPILEAFLREISKFKKCKTLCFWIREKEVNSKKKIEILLRDLRYECEATQTVLECFLIDDDRASDRLHQRCLLTIDGGVIYDQGFQILRDKKVDVSPISEANRDRLISQFISKENDLKIVDKVTLPSCS